MAADGDYTFKELGKTSRFVLHSYKVLDLWRHEHPGKEISWKDYMAWVLSSHFSAQTTPRPIQVLLQSLSGNVLLYTHTKESCTDMLDSRSNARSFRVCKSTFATRGTDGRVRALIEHVLTSHLPMRVMALICPSFTFIGESKTRRKSSPFPTTEATPFQQLLHVSAVVKLMEIVNNSRPSKRRRLDATPDEAVKVLSVQGLTDLRDPLPQKIGYIIETVVGAWNCFAEYLGFQSLERMSAPYLRLVSPLAQFEVIPTREEGFAPLSTLVKFVEDMPATNDRTKTFTDAFDRPAIVDSNLRKFVGDFFQDLERALLSSDLYSAKEVKEMFFLTKYVRRRDILPPRFRSYCAALVRQVKSYTSEIASSAALPGDPFPPPSPGATTNLASASSQVVCARHVLQVVGEAESTSTASDEASLEALNEGEDVHNERIVFSEMRKAAVRMYNCDFESFIEAYDALTEDEELHGKVQLVLTDPPFNVRRDRGRNHADYDEIRKEQYESFVNCVDEMLRPGGHALIFCSAQQFTIWREAFTAHPTTSGDSSSSSQASQPTFWVASTPLYCIYHPSVCNGFPGRATFALSNMAEVVIHVMKKGPPFKEGRLMVNYKCFNYVPSEYPATRNVINNVMGLVPGERHMVKIGDTSRMLRPEQKCVSLLKELICRFSQAGDIVVDPFAGTFSTAIACFNLDKDNGARRFIGCEKEAVCFEHAKKKVIESYAGAIVNKLVDVGQVMTDDDIHGAALYVHNRNGNRRSRNGKWAPPSGLPPYQTFPDHILAYLSTAWESPELIQKCRNVPLNAWKRELQGRFHQTDVHALRAIEAVQFGVALAPSSVRHPKAGLGLFATRTFDVDDDICLYYGTLVYHDLIRSKSKNKPYGEGLMGVDRERFMTYAMLVPTQGRVFQNVTDLIDGQKAISIVPSRFCVGAFINDHRYHPDDKDHKDFVDGRLANPRNVNVAYDLSVSKVTSTSALQKHTLMRVKALRLINPGEELFADYIRDIFIE
ncbi:adenine specific DNA methyltransferase [Chondrus crispus]|uniref:Adenine specific DNA methyltransferase n=1 Tax=Chondrus crispus TaxID=2769 RepID=R7QP00_CHOCR|nr:adenine specific DNA methyltransferase [Chondrus crispus]CDF39110.1 adenine specific DNA methyltransferase [Chondrus crispus]|eukprot:XP_005719021.1 adenine specific DNA methyltransferase [Chondrus crispus]